MSQSQQSNFASSLYDGDLDDLSCLTPSNYLATPSGSHHTIETFEPDFLRPNNLPVPPPACLTRIGPDRRKVFVLYDRMMHNDWVDWWLQTDFGSKSKINWDSARHSDVWNYYHQVAHNVDGIPKVMCQRCGAILEHPSTINPKAVGRVQYHGTSTMQKHLKTAGCLRSKQGKRAEITRFLKKGVYFSIILLFNRFLLIYIGYQSRKKL